MMFFVLTGTNSAVISFAYSGYKSFMNAALSNTEESEEESRSVTEEDDDQIHFDHRWMSREKTNDSVLHYIYQEVLFHDLELEVVVPPPRV